jgi:Pyruvate/2-oxoacid:ferredoxin oxidoreductase delta subunit
MKAKRKIIEIDEGLCSGCGVCVFACAEGAIQLVEGKAKLVSENYCDGLAACLGECPEGALRIVEREADAFDPEAVEQYLEKIKGSGQPRPSIPLPSLSDQLPCGCPSTQIQTFASPCESANRPVSREGAASALTHWPIQIRLVPPTAPFLKGSDLLVASDCTPIAYPAFHEDFLRGRTVLMGCPKFDDTEEYANKFADIFRVGGIRSVTVLIMEVPCCSKMPAIVHKGMALAGQCIPLEVVVVGVQGNILRREKLAA